MLNNLLYSIDYSNFFVTGLKIVCGIYIVDV